MKPLLSLLLLQPIMVKSSLLNSPYLVTSKTVLLPDKLLSKPFFVLVLKLLVPPQMVLPIDMVDTVVLLVPFHPPVLEEEFLPMPQTKLMLLLMLLLTKLQPNLPLLKFQFMSNHHSPLLLL